MLKTSTGAKWLLPQVQQLLERGADVTVILPEGPGALPGQIEQLGARVERLSWNFGYGRALRAVRGLLSLRRVLRRLDVQVVFHHLYASALAARLASIGLRVNRVMMVAGPLYLESPLIRRVEQVLCRLDHRIISGSDYTRDRYRELGYPAARLYPVPYGVDTSQFERGVDRRGSLYGVDDATFVVIMVAFVYRPKKLTFPGVGIKGHETLLDAWDTFTAGLHARAHLVLVGGGFDAEAEQYRLRLIQDRYLDDRDDITWFSTVDDVRDYYSSADLSVSPSLSENHGAALEASAMELPSIVSDAGALPETVTAESGWVFPAGDASALSERLREAYVRFEQEGLRAMGRAARARAVEGFDSTQSAHRVAEIVLGGPR